MYECVNPSHPDKIADRIAGALVDLSYSKQKNPKVAIEVLIGHGVCHIINETSCHLQIAVVTQIVNRIAGEIEIDYKEVPQDEELAKNQKDEIRCGDNGIFKGIPLTEEQKHLKDIAKNIYNKWPSDGKYLIDEGKLVICQSNAKTKQIRKLLKNYGPRYNFAKINPLGEWTGGTNVDCGATNRKLGSDMADSVTGGGLHGKDLSKGDVAINIYCWVLAQYRQQPVEASCAIGDTKVSVNNYLIPYDVIVAVARDYIKKLGGFEKLAEWGYQIV